MLKRNNVKFVCRLKFYEAFFAKKTTTIKEKSWFHNINQFNYFIFPFISATTAPTAAEIMTVITKSIIKF